jgi:CBS domain-containing protein
MSVKPRLTLHADTAADLMTENPISLVEHTTVRDALAMMIDRDVSAAPVINSAGRPVGVVTVTDILIHEREATVPAGIRAELQASESLAAKLGDGYQIELSDPTPVSDIMTPGLFTVTPQHSAAEVVADMLRYQVHHLFVEEGGVIVGVISSGDVLRRLAP